MLSINKYLFYSEGVLELAEQITIIRRSNDLKERQLKTAVAELRMKVLQSESLRMTSEVSNLLRYKNECNGHELVKCSPYLRFRVSKVL